MRAVDSEYAKSKDADANRRDDYAPPELKLIGKVSELAQAGGGGGGGFDGVDYS
ncbi:hypothetical protein ABIE65_003224 [Constrictibacter sp. MBR-5]|uniref:hypothetical protein n=1 Tax=Constrictibacter sp. MBR-5 TaxID=3156467 RepID=UPI003391D734